MTANIDNIVAEIVLILSEEFGDKRGPGIQAETLLLSSGLSLDSVALLQLIAAVEDTYGIEFSDDDLSTEVFESVGSLAATAQRKLAAVVS